MCLKKVFKDRIRKEKRKLAKSKQRQLCLEEVFAVIVTEHGDRETGVTPSPFSREPASAS